MKYNTDGHYACYVKKQAKKIKKELKVTHAEALDKASENEGFSNWKNFCNSIPVSDQVTIRLHQRMGELLRDIRLFSQFEVGIISPFDSLRTYLNELLKVNHENVESLEEIYSVYFKSNSRLKVEKKKKSEILLKFSILNLILKDIELKKFKNLEYIISIKLLDDAIEKFEIWADVSEEGFVEGLNIPNDDRHFLPGTFVHLEADGSTLDGLVIADDNNSRRLTIYTDYGPYLCASSEVFIYEDQSKALSFRPMRLFLPYGIWTREDGSQVLFNRNYVPIWEKKEGEKVVAIETDTIVRVKKEDWYFSDSNPPWYNEETLQKCKNILKSWKVEGCPVCMENVFFEAVRTGKLKNLESKILR